MKIDEVMAPVERQYKGMLAGLAALAPVGNLHDLSMTLNAMLRGSEALEQTNDDVDLLHAAVAGEYFEAEGALLKDFEAFALVGLWCFFDCADQERPAHVRLADFCYAQECLMESIRLEGFGKVEKGFVEELRLWGHAYQINQEQIAELLKKLEPFRKGGKHAARNAIKHAAWNEWNHHMSAPKPEYNTATEFAELFFDGLSASDQAKFGKTRSRVIADHIRAKESEHSEKEGLPKRYK
jgi:hypothetical protein